MAARRKTRARTEDRFELYERAVQNPPNDVRFLSRVFARNRGRRALHLKEDFCGTGLISVEWARSHRERTALGVDLDGEVLASGTRRHLDVAPPGIRERVSFVQANVLDVVKPKVDITCALNFSFCIFKQRDALIRYFEAARRGLKRDGLFAIDLFGGTEAPTVCEERSPFGAFTYVWQQAAFDPISADILCHIHFQFRDGSRIEKAFTYDWRLWTIPELRECLTEAGFRRVEVYWDITNDDWGEGRYRRVTRAENQEGWLVYLVAFK